MNKIQLLPVQLKQLSPAAEQEKEKKQHDTVASSRPPALQMRADSSENKVEKENQDSMRDYYADSRVARDDARASHHSPFQLKSEDDNAQNSKSDSGAGNIVQKMESAFGGHDFSSVKIHADSAEAPKVGAKAFTRGKDIHFAPGQYNPESSKGLELLGHELTHVVQQDQGRVKPTGNVNGQPLNDDKSLEGEADSLGRKFAS